MLHVHHSNRLEALIDELADLLAVPSGSVLEPETVVVQNQGMERWLMQQLAQRRGIAANIEFPLPATFIWRVFESRLGKLPRESVFDKDSLLWRIMALLPDLLPRDDFLPLRRYLEGDDSGLKTYQLCSRLADLFDQYLVYRPEMILDWEQGAADPDQSDRFESVADPWQPTLWRALSSNTDGRHRARLWQAFSAHGQTRGDERGQPLPSRVMIFGLTGMAPSYVQVLGQMAEEVDLHLFLLNPSREYWVDIVDARGQARKRAAWRRQGKEDVSGLLDVGNPLLASMGHVGQVFVDQLLELGGEEHESFHSPLVTAASLLQMVQADVLELEDSRRVDSEARQPIAATDDSIQLHICHGAMREVQVLHDRLLAMFEQMDGLEPRQVVVMAPDIESYAPYIEAVFGSGFADQQDAQHIPWSIADLSIATESPLLESLQVLLKLPELRFDASELLGLLDVPALARRFGISDEALPRIRQWVAETAIRWGLDADMREEMGLPAELANSWEAGLQSLFLGYAMAPEQDMFAGVRAYPHMEGNEVDDLGRLQAFVSSLALWRSRLAREHDPATWRALISDLLNDFFTVDTTEEALLQAVRDGLDDLDSCAARAEFDGELGLAVIRHHLDQVLTDSSQARRFLAGGVTFCNMVPMRSIPFRVVCLLGMNDSDFPRDQRAPGFDLMARNPRPTDRSRRLDDRYLFLEALLSARDVFYISYVGHDIRDNSVKIASVVVSELMEYLALSFQAEHLSVEHPLQAFSKDYYRRDQRPDLFSFDAYWLAAANVRGQQETPFADQDLPQDQSRKAAGEDPRSVDLADLIRFLLNPSEWYLRRRLGVTFGDAEEALEDLEPFAINGLDRYGLRQQALGATLADESMDELQQLTRASGLLPHGKMGDLSFQLALEDMDELGARILGRLGEKRDALEVNLNIAGIHLIGWLDHRGSNGRVVYRATKLKARDQISLWIQHLCLNAMQDDAQSSGQSVHVAEDQTLIFAAMDGEQAERHLSKILEAWTEGQIRPLKFYPATSLAYVEAWGSDQSDAQIIKKTNEKWLSNERTNVPGESDDPYVATAQRGGEPLDEGFEQWSQELLLPMVRVAELIPAIDDLPESDPVEAAS